MRKRHWLFALLAFVAVTAQLVVAIAPLTEGRDGRMASHVESQGARTHFLHDDATCAACQARSIHGTTAHTTVAVLTVGHAPSAIVRAADRAESPDGHTQQNPRAPPRVI